MAISHQIGSPGAPPRSNNYGSCRFLVWAQVKQPARNCTRELLAQMPALEQTAVATGVAQAASIGDEVDE
eukprot:6371630-Alexandrium_andersonii.AAC.1